MTYNIVNEWDTFHIWIKVEKDLKKWEWINIDIPTRNIKRKVVDEFQYLDNFNF